MRRSLGPYECASEWTVVPSKYQVDKLALMVCSPSSQSGQMEASIYKVGNHGNGVDSARQVSCEQNRVLPKIRHVNPVHLHR